MGLEEITEAFADQAMSEYLDAATGFRMQYPAFFRFEDDGSQPPAAVSEDGKATLIIENMPVQGELDEETLLQAIRMETPNADPVRNEQNGCLRMDRSTGNGEGIRTDLYFLTSGSFHHITLFYPAEEKENYNPFIEYMINSMETDQTDLG
jgi:hypothetical protein